jgi:cyanate permease
MNMGNQIGAALTASLTPWIAVRFGWTTSFLVAAGLCIVGAASWLVVDPSRSLTVPVGPETVHSVERIGAMELVKPDHGKAEH